MRKYRDNITLINIEKRDVKISTGFILFSMTKKRLVCKRNFFRNVLSALNATRTRLIYYAVVLFLKQEWRLRPVTSTLIISGVIGCIVRRPKIIIYSLNRLTRRIAKEGQNPYRAKIQMRCAAKPEQTEETSINRKMSKVNIYLIILAMHTDEFQI